MNAKEILKEVNNNGNSTIDNVYIENGNSEDPKKNKDFVQLYRKHMAEVRWLARNNSLACEIFLFILEHMDTSNALACSYAILEDYTGKSKSSVTRAIKVLRENGFLSILKMGTCNVYVINQDVAWSSYGDSKEYCKFNGTMLVSKKENKDLAYKKSYDKVKKLTNPNLKKEGEF